MDKKTNIANILQRVKDIELGQNKTSNQKGSKLYTKKYRGQGR